MEFLEQDRHLDLPVLFMVLEFFETFARTLSSAVRRLLPSPNTASLAMLFGSNCTCAFPAVR